MSVDTMQTVFEKNARVEKSDFHSEPFKKTSQSKQLRYTYHCGFKSENEYLKPSSKKFRIYKYRNPKTSRTKQIFKCEFTSCSRSFRKIHNFLDHLRTHTGEKPYICPYIKTEGCSKSFAQKSNLNKHIKAIHEK